MLLIPNIRLNLDEPKEAAIDRAKKLLSLHQNDISEAHITKISLDARKRSDIHFVCTIGFSLQQAELPFIIRFPALNLRQRTASSIDIMHGKTPINHRPVIAGFGPAGMFCALLLAKHGYCPLVLERGADIDSRTMAVKSFQNGGTLDPNANIQFGEGGAGTFSDGKLTTRINDPYCETILHEFVRFGAPQDILYKSKPHIGTDILRKIIKHIREEIIFYGGEVRFNTALSDITLSPSGLLGITANGQSLPCSTLILAIGHSARDTFSMLRRHNIPMTQKPFSVGVRIEHLQSDIDYALYGEFSGHPMLPQGEYQLSLRENEKAVYTFCMCPGGFVVPAASEEFTVVTNGMSEHARNGKNANSALVASVDSDDFGTDLFAGIEFQQHLERLAYKIGGQNYYAPAQNVGSYLNGKAGLKLGRILPSYLPGVSECNFNTILPPRINSMLHKGLRTFHNRINCFACADAILTGFETRTSSPIRILRNDSLQSSCTGIFPCGEGAGYAGGIMSAAVDGMHVAQAIIEHYSPLRKI